MCDDSMAYLGPALHEAANHFTNRPTPRTAGAYLRVLLDAQGNDLITDDEALDGLYTVIDFLEHGPFKVINNA
jgi:hypothetical protein